MKSTGLLPSIRDNAENPNHHLWNNHGTWFLHHTVHPTQFTKERIRFSLKTKDIVVARERRDSYLATLIPVTTDSTGRTQLAKKAVAA